jgi:Ferritin-like domain
MAAGPTPARADRRALGVGLSALLVELATGVARASADMEADVATDIQILQAAASVENVLVGTYETLLALPLVTGQNANPYLRTVLQGAHDHHVDHASACNDMATKLGGRPQTGINAGLAQVAATRPTDLAGVVDLALRLETAAAQTYENDLGLLGDLNARRLAASIMGIEAEHVGVLNLAAAIVAARTPELLVADSGTAGRLPPEAATAALPESFTKTDQARPPTEGALR